MIFPDEYKTIGWTGKGKAAPDEHKVYFLSQYIFEETDAGFNLYKISHEGSGFLREPVDSTLIASADEVIFCPSELNLKNRTLLIETADRLIRDENEKRNSGQKKATTVVFKGFDKHLTFIKDPDVTKILEIQVIDIYPPEPPWLTDCINRLNASNIFGDLQIRFTEKIIDISVYQGEKTIYPCRSSGLFGKYLDSDDLDENEDGWLLVGCDTSRQIIELMHPNMKYDFADMCPMRSKLTMPEKTFIMRCCKSENSGKIVHINGQKGVIVHWGAGEWQIAESIRKLALER
jgi:hypothetical protein